MASCADLAPLDSTTDSLFPEPGGIPVRPLARLTHDSSSSEQPMLIRDALALDQFVPGKSPVPSCETGPHLTTACGGGVRREASNPTPGLRLNERRDAHRQTRQAAAEQNWRRYVRHRPAQAGGGTGGSRLFGAPRLSASARAVRLPACFQPLLLCCSAAIASPHPHHHTTPRTHERSSSHPDQARPKAPPDGP